MPHHGQYEHVKEWLQDHDAYEVNETPPVQNIWYEAFHEEDVRHLWCAVRQSNDEAAAKDIEVRWTIDGNVYFYGWSLANATWEFMYKDRTASGGGTAGLLTTATIINAAYYVDKRGHDYQVEARITSVPGTNQTLICRNVIETLEVT